MTGFLVIAMLLCLLKDVTYKAMAWDGKDFFSYCPPSRCSKQGPEIRFPFRLESSGTSSLCEAPDLKLECSGEDTILVHPSYAPYIVTAIDYRRGTLTLLPRVDSSPSCRQKLMSAALPHSTVDYEDPFTLLRNLGYAVIVSCLTEITPSNRASNYIFGPISCLSNTSYFSYLVDGSAHLYVLPLDCKVVPDSFFSMPRDDSTFKEIAEGILNFSEATFTYCSYDISGFKIFHDCTQCGIGGQYCGFNPQRNQTFCMNHGIFSNWSIHYKSLQYSISSIEMLLCNSLNFIGTCIVSLRRKVVLQSADHLGSKPQQAN
jgi:hypothetical protein